MLAMFHVFVIKLLQEESPAELPMTPSQAVGILRKASEVLLVNRGSRMEISNPRNERASIIIAFFFAFFVQRLPK